MTTSLDGIPSRYEPTGDKFSGGQGDVYICRDKFLERKVAIKFIQTGGEPAALMKELNALQSIRSKHVVEIFDVVQLSGKHIGLVQEFVPGNDLTAKIPTPTSKAIEAGAFVALMYQLASGVRDIHAANLIHRDLKPKNIKINNEGILKIFDFGLVKDIKPLVSTVGFKGTFGFAAPELYDIAPKFNENVDVFAMGVTAWILATGGIPAALKQHPPKKLTSSIAAIRPDFPSSIVNILDKSLELKPADRPSSAEFSAVFASRLMYGKHVGLFAGGSKRYLLDKPGGLMEIDHRGKGRAIASYDGERFFLEVASGDVFLNAKRVVGKIELTGACVLIFGGPEAGSARLSLPFFVSHPEIVL